MCGIVAYIGEKQAVPILVEGLKRLEYRGYDSAGLALIHEGTIQTIRTVGKVSSLELRLLDHEISSTCGIAHTRWATHGKPTEANAHPHSDCQGKISLIHNGIIENYSELKAGLIRAGHQFHSETDTEVIAHLIESCDQGHFEEAVLAAVKKLSGTFGLAILHRDHPGKIILVKRGSPIILGIGEEGMYAASDAQALAPYTGKMVTLGDDEMAVITPTSYTIKTFDNRISQKPVEKLEKDQYDLDKKGFEHHMLKEIFEQPESVRNAIRGRLIRGEGVSKLGGLEPVLGRLQKMRKLIIVSCGTSYYAGMLGRYIFEQLTDLIVEVELASEFRYRRLQLDESIAVLAISQSGETADTLAALKEAKRKGALLLGIVNAVGTSIANITEAGVYNHAGPEIGVASTKIYTSQITVMVLMALLIGRYQGLSFTEGSEITESLLRLPDQISEILSQADSIQTIAEQYSQYANFLFIGRLYNYPTALEGALKLKEITYLHAEGYAAGEMKHGPISLIEPRFPTVAIAPLDQTFEKMVGNIQEIKARNGRVLAITTTGHTHLDTVCDDVIRVPSTISILQPILNIIPLQLFAYHIAKKLGRDIDKPRNLAKSVTVE
jgi:glucosamine--fructose-6-phosphate aminotransferase (isomerizing)